MGNRNINMPITNTLPSLSGQLLMPRTLTSPAACMTVRKGKKARANHRSATLFERDTLLETQINDLIGQGKDGFNIRPSASADIQRHSGLRVRIFDRRFEGSEIPEWHILDLGCTTAVYVNSKLTQTSAQLYTGTKIPIFPGDLIRFADKFIIFQDPTPTAPAKPSSGPSQDKTTKRPRTRQAHSKQRKKKTTQSKTTSGKRKTRPRTQRADFYPRQTELITKALKYYGIPLNKPFNSIDTARTTYRAIAQATHPDLHRNNSKTAAQFIKARDAYDHLSTFASFAKNNKLFGKTPTQIIDEIIRMKKDLKLF